MHKNWKCVGPVVQEEVQYVTYNKTNGWIKVDIAPSLYLFIASGNLHRLKRVSKEFEFWASVYVFGSF